MDTSPVIGNRWQKDTPKQQILSPPSGKAQGSGGTTSLTQEDTLCASQPPALGYCGPGEYQEKPVHAGPGQGEKRGWSNNGESRQVPVLSWSQSQTQY